MKKFLSLLLATVVASSLFATTAFAAGNTSATFSATEVNVGDTFTVTINTAEKKVYMEDTKFRFGDGTTNFKDKFEVVSIADRDNYTSDQWYYHTYSAGRETAKQTLEFAEQADNFTWSYLGSSPVTYLACDSFAVITLKALEAGEYTFQVEEYTDNTQKSDDTGYNGICATQTVVVKSAAPVLDEAIEVGETSTDDAVAGTRTWAVEVGADLIANGKIKAVLTNSHADVAADNTQEVALSFGTVDKDSEMDCQFNVVVKFQDYAKYAATTNLDIVKAN